jgi:hypothetical protein
MLNFLLLLLLYLFYKNLCRTKILFNTLFLHHFYFVKKIYLYICQSNSSVNEVIMHYNHLKLGLETVLSY